MANLSLNYFAIKATDSEMTKFLLSGTGKNKVTANTADDALKLLLSTKHKRGADDWRKEESIYLCDFAETDDDAKMSYMRIVPSACDDKLVLVFECSTAWEYPEDWICGAEQIADVEINWYSAEEFGAWRNINGRSFSGALVDVDGKNAVESSCDNSSRTEIEADIFLSDVINGRAHQFCRKVEDHEFSEVENKSPLSVADEEKAREAYDKAADYYNDGNNKKAFEYFLKAAEVGLPDAMSVMGQIYDGRLSDDVVEADEKRAFEWFAKAAACGDSDAQCELGQYYLNGTGCEKDIQKAIHWFKAAAHRSFFDNPSDEACYWLGMIYYVGAGVEKNLRLAYCYFKNSYGLRCAAAIPMLYRCYTRGEGISANEVKANELKEVADDAGISVDEIQGQIAGYEID